MCLGWHSEPFTWVMNLTNNRQHLQQQRDSVIPLLHKTPKRNISKKDITILFSWRMMLLPM